MCREQQTGMSSNHREPIHEVLHAFNLRLEAFLEDWLCQVQLKMGAQAKMHIPGSRETAIEDAREAHVEVQVYADGSGIGGVGAMAVL